MRSFLNITSKYTMRRHNVLLDRLWHTDQKATAELPVHLPSFSIGCRHRNKALSPLPKWMQRTLSLQCQTVLWRGPSSHRLYPLQQLKHTVWVARPVCLFLQWSCQVKNLPRWPQVHSTLCDCHAVHLPQHHSSRRTVQQCQGICSQGSGVRVFCWVQVGL